MAAICWAIGKGKEKYFANFAAVFIQRGTCNKKGGKY